MAAEDSTVNGELTVDTARFRFEIAAQEQLPIPNFRGRGIIITAGGPFVPSAYVGVRLLRGFGVKLPIEIWHAGEDEIPGWSRRAFEACDISLHDVMEFCPERSLSDMRGWPIKPAALMHSRLREVLFLDADCFVLRNPEFLFETPEFEQCRALFWPDSKFIRLVPGGSVWSLTGMPYRGDNELETGIFVVDKQSCWRELCLTQWMNAHSSFWYQYVLGDKDTFYLAWRKLERNYFLAPPCTRLRAVLTRHYWTDGGPIADHRTGTSKYALPKQRGPFNVHLAPYGGRPVIKNIYDELMQRYFVTDFSLHAKYLEELKRFQNA